MTEAEEAAHDRAQRHHDRIVRANVPAAFRHLRLAQMDSWPGDAVLAAHTWAQHGGVLVLVGPNGTGKTSLAAAALIERLSRRPGGRFIRAIDLASMASADFGSGDVERAHKIARATSALVLDDLGHERGSEAAAEVIKRAIASRVDEGSALIVTTNMTVPQLAARPHYGTWLGSRLADRRHAVQLLMEGRDHRLETP